MLFQQSLCSCLAQLKTVLRGDQRRHHSGMLRRAVAFRPSPLMFFSAHRTAFHRLAASVSCCASPCLSSCTAVRTTSRPVSGTASSTMVRPLKSLCCQAATNSGPDGAWRVALARRPDVFDVVDDMRGDVGHMFFIEVNNVFRPSAGARPYRTRDSAMTRSVLPVLPPTVGSVTALNPLDGTPSIRSFR